MSSTEECKVCYLNRRDALLLPCAHLVICQVEFDRLSLNDRHVQTVCMPKRSGLGPTKEGVLSVGGK